MARDQSLERAWRKRMREYEQSGLTVKQFCQREGLVGHQFSWWRRELKRRQAESASGGDVTGKVKPSKRTKRDNKRRTAAKRFVPVEVKPSSRGDASIEIVLDQPPRIIVSSGFDVVRLREIVRVLEPR